MGGAGRILARPTRVSPARKIREHPSETATRAGAASPAAADSAAAASAVVGRVQWPSRAHQDPVSVRVPGSGQRETGSSPPAGRPPVRPVPGAQSGSGTPHSQSHLVGSVHDIM